MSVDKNKPMQEIIPEGKGIWAQLQQDAYKHIYTFPKTVINSKGYTMPSQFEIALKEYVESMRDSKKERTITLFK